MMVWKWNCKDGGLGSSRHSNAVHTNGITTMGIQICSKIPSIWCKHDMMEDTIQCSMPKIPGGK